MKAYITDEELLQQVQKLADKLPPEERLLILELPLR
jgi:signal recognition particle GTPase